MVRLPLAAVLPVHSGPALHPCFSLWLLSSWAAQSAQSRNPAHFAGFDSFLCALPPFGRRPAGKMFGAVSNIFRLADTPFWALSLISSKRTCGLWPLLLSFVCCLCRARLGCRAAPKPTTGAASRRDQRDSGKGLRGLWAAPLSSARSLGRITAPVRAWDGLQQHHPQGEPWICCPSNGTLPGIPSSAERDWNAVRNPAA